MYGFLLLLGAVALWWLWTSGLRAWFIFLLLIEATGFVMWAQITVYRWAKIGRFFVSVPPNSMLAILVGRNISRAIVTPPDKRTAKYFKWLHDHPDQAPHGHLYRIIPPGFPGLAWKGLPEKTDVPRIADTQELLDVSPDADILHAIRMQVRELTYDFEPSATELAAIRKEVADAAEANRKAGRRVQTVDASKVRKLQYTPNQRSADQIEIKGRLRVFLECVHPALSITEIDKPQDMIRGRIMPVYRAVVADLEYYRAFLEMKAEKQADEVKKLLISQVQNKLREALGFTDPSKGAPTFEINEDGSPGYLDQAKNPFNKDSNLDRIMRDWGYYLVDVVVDDVAPTDPKIDEALAGAVAAAANATRDLRQAEGDKQARIKRAEGIKQEAILLAEGERATVAAYSDDGKTVDDDSREARLTRGAQTSWESGVSKAAPGKVVVVGAPGSKTDPIAGAAAALTSIVTGTKDKDPATKPEAEEKPPTTEGPSTPETPAS